MNITPLDWAVLVGYLVVITAIGLIVGYRVRQTASTSSASAVSGRG